MALRLPKLILAVPFYLYLRRVRGIESAWWNGLVAGAIGAGVYALWFSLSGQTGQYGWRVTGPTNPIYFGGLVLAYALMLIPRLADSRSEEHTSELQSRGHLVCRLLLEKKKTKK